MQGEVLPISINSAHVCAELSDGEVVCGEGFIDTRSVEDARTVGRVWLEPQAFITREAAEAIIAADVIVLGPGDLYTSIVPNLLVSGIQKAIAESKARLVYVCNIMTKSSETRDFTVADFVDTLLAYGVGREQFDSVIVNTVLPPNDVLATYAAIDRSFPVDFSAPVRERVAEKTKRIVYGDFFNEAGLEQGLIRHDSHKLAYQLIQE